MNGLDGSPLALLIQRSGGERYPIWGSEVVVGRREGNAVVVDHPSVAAEHARVRLAGGVWSLADGGSVQGSAVDGEVAVGPLALAPGSIVRLGEVELVFDPRDRWEDSPAPASDLPVFDIVMPSHGGVPVRLLMWTAVGAVTLVGFFLVWGG